MDRHTPLISADYICASLQYSWHLGITTEAMSHASGINLSDLDTRRSRFSLDDTIRLIHANTQLTGLPHYGLANGNFASLSCHGMGGVMAMYQATYADCLNTGGQLCNRLFPPLTMHYFETSDQVGLRIYECLSLAPSSPFFMEWIMVNFHNILQFLLGDDHQPDYIAFPYPAPAYAELYPRFLECPIYFNVEHAEFVVNKTVAQQPLPLSNARIARIAEQRMHDTLPNGDRDLSRQVRELLARNIDARLSLEDVATHLHINSRTLRRQLKKSGTSFVDIVDALRREAAITQLTYSHRPITDIAASLSFSDSSSFSKAFKRWTGQSPRAFREEAVG